MLGRVRVQPALTFRVWDRSRSSLGWLLSAIHKDGTATVKRVFDAVAGRIGPDGHSS